MTLPYFERTVVQAGVETIIVVPIFAGFRAVKLLITAKCNGPQARYSMGLQFNGNSNRVYNWTDISGRNNPATGNGMVEARVGGNLSEVRAPLGIIPGGKS